MVRLIYEEDYTNFNKRYKDKSIPAELGLTIGSIVNSQRIINQSLTMEEKEREIDMCKALENLVNNSKLEEKKESLSMDEFKVTLREFLDKDKYYRAEKKGACRNCKYQNICRMRWDNE